MSLGKRIAAFSWIAVIIWVFVTASYIIWQCTVEKRRRRR